MVEPPRGSRFPRDCATVSQMVLQSATWTTGPHWNAAHRCVNLNTVTPLPALQRTTGCRCAEKVFKAAAKRRSDCNWVIRRSCCCHAAAVAAAVESPEDTRPSLSSCRLKPPWEPEKLWILWGGGTLRSGGGARILTSTVLSLTLLLFVALCTFTLDALLRLGFGLQLPITYPGSWRFRLRGRGFRGLVILNLVKLCNL